MKQLTVLWDTTVASRIHPKTEVFEYVAGRAAAGEPVRVAAPAVLEVAYGYGLEASGDPRFAELLEWFTRLVASDAFGVVPFGGRAAIVAGGIRSEAPHPPARRRGDRRSKTMRQAAWLLDIQIAATAFAAGLDIATDNRDDFELIAELIARIYPDAPGLEVQRAPV